MKVSEEEYFVIGAPEPQYYMHWKANGCGGCYTECSEPEDAEKFHTRREAHRVMTHDEDARDWVKKISRTFCVRIVRVRKIVKVY